MCRRIIFASVAAFKAHDIISMYGSPDWHGRGQRLIGLWRFSKLTDRVMHGRD